MIDTQLMNGAQRAKLITKLMDEHFGRNQWLKAWWKVPQLRFRKRTPAQLWASGLHGQHELLFLAQAGDWTDEE